MDRLRRQGAGAHGRARCSSSRSRTPARHKVTKTDVDACAARDRGRARTALGRRGIAHAFQEGHPVIVGDERRIRYVAPADIQDDTDLRVVFFKRSLTTGWDCPRAEVMMSFRKAVGPDAHRPARRAHGPHAAGTVASAAASSSTPSRLYLPYYDEEALD